MANTLDDDLKRTDWLLNRGLWHLLNGYIKLAQAQPEWIVSPQKLENVPSDVCSCQCFEEGIREFETAKEQFKEIRAGHHELKACLGAILCQYGDDGDSDAAINGRDDLKNGFENSSNIAGERHLFKIDTEVMKAIVQK
ncbi:MAG: hypothetical protein D3922_09735 [Candidatus Electrothrix sp. AR1]|nr:hypothetical protein [Candidatus Electrothrix sp. AR1]